MSLFSMLTWWHSVYLSWISWAWRKTKDICVQFYWSCVIFGCFWFVWLLGLLEFGANFLELFLLSRNIIKLHAVSCDVSVEWYYDSCLTEVFNLIFPCYSGNAISHCLGRSSHAGTCTLKLYIMVEEGKKMYLWGKKLGHYLP